MSDEWHTGSPGKRGCHPSDTNMPRSGGLERGMRKTSQVQRWRVAFTLYASSPGSKGMPVDGYEGLPAPSFASATL